MALFRADTRQKNKRRLDHLKMLPLTILVTVLLWMYAESHFNQTDDHVPVAIRVLGSPRLVQAHEMLHMLSPSDGQFTMTIQGPRREVSRTQEQCDGQIGFTQQDLNNLVYVASRRDHLRVGSNNVLNSVRVLNALPYFRQRKIRVVTAHPSHIRLALQKLAYIQRPIMFHALRGVNAVITPPTATVEAPQSVLAAVGGPNQLHVLAEPLVNVNTFLPGSVHRITAELHVHYPGIRNKQIVVSPQTASVRFRVPRQPEHILVIPRVPVYVTGPPSVLNQYVVRLRPRYLRITVIGPAKVINHLRNELTDGRRASAPGRVAAYVYVTSSEHPSHTLLPHSIRYMFPRGVHLQRGPHHVALQIKLRPAAVTTPE